MFMRSAVEEVDAVCVVSNDEYRSQHVISLMFV